LTLAFVISMLDAPGDLARRALVPALARWAAMPLERANAADTAIPGLAQLVAPVMDCRHDHEERHEAHACSMSRGWLIFGMGSKGGWPRNSGC